jgi:hypothetical protein
MLNRRIRQPGFIGAKEKGPVKHRALQFSLGRLVQSLLTLSA